MTAELIGNGHDIGRELRERIGTNAAGLVTLVVTALVWDNNTKPSERERLDLPVPAIPEFRKSVEKENEWSIVRTCGYGVKSHTVIAKVQSL